MKVLKECVAVLGLTVVGALMPTVVKANVGISNDKGGEKPPRRKTKVS